MSSLTKPALSGFILGCIITVTIHTVQASAGVVSPIPSGISAIAQNGDPVPVTATPTPTATPKPTPTPTPKETPTPTPTPTPSKPPLTGPQLDELFTRFSNSYSIDRSLLWKIAVCESFLRPGAKNGIYGGMYQFSPSTWRSNRIRMNKDPDPNLRFDPEVAIETAAFVISTRGANAWPNCK